MTQTEKIRALNIAFWRNPLMCGRLMMSRYVTDRGPLFQQKCIEALATYVGWTFDNDPWNEADFSTLDINGEKVFCKIGLLRQARPELRERRSGRSDEDAEDRHADDAGGILSVGYNC